MQLDKGLMLEDRVSKGEIFQDFIPRILCAKSKFENNQYIYGNFVNDGVGVKTITFQVTEYCNLACTYCYQINKSKEKLDIEKAKKFIELLIKESYDENSHLYWKKTPGIVIEFIGGEPLLEVELLDDIYDYFRNRLIEEHHPWAVYNVISMISNGVRYMEDDVQEFLNKNKDLVSFSISLDGNKELHDACRVFHNGCGSYDKVVAACKHYMANHNELMFTKMTLAPENISYTYDAFVNLISLGYKYIHGNCVYENVWDKEKHPRIFYDQLVKLADYIFDNDLDNIVEISIFDEEHCQPYNPENDMNYCGSTCSMLAINNDGDIYPCVRFMKSSLGDRQKPYSIGNLEEGIAVSGEYKKRFEELFSVTRTGQSTEKCNNCQIGSGCGWCTAYNYQTTGTVNQRVVSICEMHQARALANTYYWNKYYKKNSINKKYVMNIPKEWALSIITEEEYEMLINLI